MKIQLNSFKSTSVVGEDLKIRIQEFFPDKNQLDYMKSMAKLMKQLNISTTYNKIADDFLKNKVFTKKEAMFDAREICVEFPKLLEELGKPIIEDLRDFE